MNNPVIHSLLQTDLYKFSMMQAVLHQCPNTNVIYKFKCRNKDVDISGLKCDIELEIDEMCKLSFTEDELDYLKTIRFIKPDFIEFLRNFKLNKRYISIEPVDNTLDITIDGPWIQTILFEIYLLAIIHQVYTINKYNRDEIKLLEMEGINRLFDKIKKLEEAKCSNGIDDGCITPIIFDFGTRRAFTQHWLEYVVQTLSDNKVITGTSNVYLAKKYGITPIGTFAHEWICAFQGFDYCSLQDSQTKALQTWADEYRGDLGIALSDTLGTEKFLTDFDPYFAKLYDGCRHDSGDPIEWGDTIIKHYESMRIDPKSKMLVFSDGLDIDTVIKLSRYFKNKINVSFGVGTNFSNDLGVPALQNVIKLVECNGNPVAKISNNPSKTMCQDELYLTYLKKVIK